MDVRLARRNEFVGPDGGAFGCGPCCQTYITHEQLFGGWIMNFSSLKSGTFALSAFVLLAPMTLPAPAQDKPTTFDRTTQMGPDPVLPEPNSYLMPPMRVAKPVGWQNGEKPTVPAGFKIEAIATGLVHPRQPYVLPNG